MLTTYKPQFLEKVIVYPDGRQFRLIFLVAIVNGELKGRLVSVQPIAESNSAIPHSECAIMLPVLANEAKPQTAYIFNYKPIVSPYDSLRYFVSQPTRAPSTIL